jgi:phage-related protein
MSNVIGHATLNVVPSTKGFGSALDGELGPVGKSGGKALGDGILGAASSALGPLAGVVAGVFATGAIVSWGKEQIEALGRVEQINSQTANVIKSTGNAANVTAEGVEALAGKLEGLTGTEAESIQEGANLLLTFKNIKNEAGAGNDIFDQTVVAMTDMARAMGTDAKGGAIQLGKALNDPVAGISALSRVGITFTDDQKAVIASLVETGQVAEAQKIILGELNSQFGGSGQAYAQTYAGKVDLLGHAWGTFGETLFSSAMPAMGGAVGLLTTITEVATGVIDILFNGNYEASFFRAIGLYEDDPAIDVLFKLREGILDVFAAISTGNPQALTKVLVGLITGAAEARDGILSALAEAVPSILTAVLDMAPAILMAAVQSFSALITGLLNTLPPLLSTVLGMVPTIITTLLSLVPMLLTAALSLFSSLVSAVLLVLPQLLSTLVSMLPAIAAAILGMLPQIVEAGLNLFMGLVQAVITLVPVLLTTVLELLPVLITTILGMLPGILTAGVELFLGLVMAVVQMLPTLITTLVGILPSLVQTLVGMVPTLIGTGIELFLSLVKAVLRVLPQLIGTILTQVIPALIGAVLQAVPQLLRAGIDLIAGLVSGLWRAAGQVGAALLDIIGGAVDGFLAFLGIHSPSRLFRGFGQNIGQGLAGGIEDMEGGVAGAARTLSDAAVDGFGSPSLDIDGGLIGQVGTLSATLDSALGGFDGPDINIHANDPHLVGEVVADKLRRR